MLILLLQICLGCYTIYLAIKGFGTGEVEWGEAWERRVYDQRQDPANFWFVVVSFLLFGLVAILMGLGLLSGVIILP